MENLYKKLAKEFLDKLYSGENLIGKQDRAKATETLTLFLEFLKEYK